eukprot:5206525-Amphidinium_carterae.1
MLAIFLNYKGVKGGLVYLSFHCDLLGGVVGVMTLGHLLRHTLGSCFGSIAGLVVAGWLLVVVAVCCLLLLVVDVGRCCLLFVADNGDVGHEPDSVGGAPHFSDSCNNVDHGVLGCC